MAAGGRNRSLMDAAAVAGSVDRSDPERALPYLLLLMLMVTGLVDAVSYLKLGQVFVANMTGNVQFAGFSFARAPSLPLVSGLLAVAFFVLGAVAAGRLGRAMGNARSAFLRAATAIQLLFILSAMALTVVAGKHLAGPTTLELIAWLALTMGFQGAATARLKVPGFNSTVVLTTMLATLATESRLAGGSGAGNGWRVLAILSLFAGALVGGALTLREGILPPLILIALLLALAAGGAHCIARLSAGSPKGPVPSNTRG
ncbi:MAG TPA: YoaK family protein [Candidatus Dormibacteraeota bacterium]|nr:YoaK family protein [Candidatus Dormibacteraeota bacterium]